jgi:hypothetical protein
MHYLGNSWGNLAGLYTTEMGGTQNNLYRQNLDINSSTAANRNLVAAGITAGTQFLAENNFDDGMPAHI